MQYLRTLAIVILITLTGCTALSPNASPVEEPDNTGARDLTGTWNVIFHYEVGENIHIPAKLTIQRAECLEQSCNLSGFVESDELGAFQRLPFKYAYYYPQFNLLRLSYSYKTVDTFTRTVVLSMTDFPSIRSAQSAMAGDFVIYGAETPATFFNTQDEEILKATRKGKAVHAGQITAWLGD